MLLCKRIDLKSFVCVSVNTRTCITFTCIINSFFIAIPIQYITQFIQFNNLTTTHLLPLFNIMFIAKSTQYNATAFVHACSRPSKSNIVSQLEELSDSNSDDSLPPSKYDLFLCKGII